MIRTIQRASCPHRSAQKIIPRVIKLRDVTRQACRAAVMAVLHAFPARIARQQRPGIRAAVSQIKNGANRSAARPLARAHPPTPIRFLFFGSFFSFSERKERTPPPAAARTPRGGPPAGSRSSPSPIRFLFFGSFFSFPERKERTEHPFSFPESKERTEKKRKKQQRKSVAPGRRGGRISRPPLQKTPRPRPAPRARSPPRAWTRAGNGAGRTGRRPAARQAASARGWRR